MNTILIKWVRLHLPDPFGLAIDRWGMPPRGTDDPRSQPKPRSGVRPYHRKPLAGIVNHGTASGFQYGLSGSSIPFHSCAYVWV